MWFIKLKSIFKGEKDNNKIDEELPPGPDGIIPDADSTSSPVNNTAMDTDKTSDYAEVTEQPEFEYLDKLIRFRMNNYFPSEKNNRMPPFPAYKSWFLPLEKFIEENSLSEEEVTILLIGIVPHIKPQLFDAAIESKMPPPEPERPPIAFPQIGGVRGNNSRFFLPSGETVLFLLADDDIKKRLEIRQLFGAEHIFWEKKIIWLEDMQNGEPAMHGRLVMSPDYIDKFLYGEHKSPQFSISFPAKKIAPVKDKTKQTPPSFEDLVIPSELREQIDELESWLEYKDELMNKYEMRDRLKKGYRTLFYGPPGTGKTFTAQILGNHLEKEVFKIDLSMVVSKYIGETEKNLELLFARAEDKNWILFFDEADALFGKRTSVRDAHDKYANQEVSYLLQRIEDYNGLVILATNMKNNIDDAFIRRFNSILKFPFPDPAQRALIWKKVLPKDALFKKKIITGNPTRVKEEPADIPAEVKKYELAGGNIINVVQYASIKALAALHEKEKQPKKELIHQVDLTGCIGEQPKEPVIETEPKLTIYLGDVLDGIKRELIKEGKPFTL